MVRGGEGETAVGDGNGGVSPPRSAVRVTLRRVTRASFRSVVALRVAPAQEKFVATNSQSIAEATFAPEAWFRAIYAGERPVGFVMLEEHLRKGEYGVWRFMIDARHQGKGYGRRAMELVIARARTRPKARFLLLSHVPGRGSPGSFYRSLGFVYTGEVDDGERIMSLDLRRATPPFPPPRSSSPSTAAAPGRRRTSGSGRA